MLSELAGLRYPLSTQQQMGTFSNKGKEGSKWRGMGSAFHQLCPRSSGTLTPTAPRAIRLWETFTFLFAKVYFNFM